MRRLPTFMPALVSPFTRSGDLDLDAHGGNVARLTAGGVHGVVVAGSTGEGPYLEPGERGLLCAGARAAAPSGFVMCGIAAESVRQALTQIGEAKDGGADAALVLTPTSLARGREDLVAGFFTDVADAAPIPIFLYTFTRVAGWELPVESARALAAHPNIAGMKDSNGNPARVSAVLAGAPDGFAVFAGASPAVALSIAAGAHGSITASGNYAWDLNARVVTAARRSPTSAMGHQAALTALAGAVERHGLPATKHAAGLAGIQAGPPRRPLRAAPAAVRRAVTAALQEAGITR